MSLFSRLKERFSGNSVALDELAQKNARQAEVIENYKQKFREYNTCIVERNLYSDLTAAFAGAASFDELFKDTLEVFSHHLKARYYGIFWLDTDGERFAFRFGKGYQAAAMPLIPRQGSLQGRSLRERKVLYVKDLKAEKENVLLNQDPVEYNGLFAPVMILGKEAGVVTLANLDPEAAETARTAVEAVMPLFNAALERLLFHEQNERNRRALEASHNVARALEHTVDDAGIFDKVCPEAEKLFPCAACLAIEAEDGKMPVVKAVHPRRFSLGGNPDSQSILLKNFIAAYPAGEAVIPDLHADRRWAWPDASVRSLCMVRLSEASPFRLLAVGPATEVYDETTRDLLELLAMQTAVTLERAAHFREQESLARKDGLTGLLNHRVFQETLKEEVERSRRYKRPLTLIMMDVDNFKKYNDAHGHPAGDTVLRMVSGHLQHDPRATDRTFRYGGEEFCILLPETPGDKALIMAERVRTRIADDRTCAQPVTISMGLTVYKGQETGQAFVDRADQALYNAKRTGKNKVVVF